MNDQDLKVLTEYWLRQARRQLCTSYQLRDAYSHYQATL